MGGGGGGGGGVLSSGLLSVCYTLKIPRYLQSCRKSPDGALEIPRSETLKVRPTIGIYNALYLPKLEFHNITYIQVSYIVKGGLELTFYVVPLSVEY